MIAKNDHMVKKSDMKGVALRPGEPIQVTLRRFSETGSEIEHITPPIFGDEYMPGHDIRTDRWDIVYDFQGKVSKWQLEQAAKIKGTSAETINSESR